MQVKPHKKFHRSLSMFMSLVLVLGMMVPCISANAFSVYTTQVTVDDIAWQIIAGVVEEDVGFWSDNSVPNEVRRIGKNDLNSMAVNGGNPGVSAGLLSGLDLDVQGTAYTDLMQNNLIMTYPGKIEKAFIHESSTPNDLERATTVKDTLIYDLNSAYQFVYDNKTPSNITQYKKKMVALLSAVGSRGSVNGAIIRNAKPSEVNISDPSMNSSDYIAITKNQKTAIFAYRIPKGYVPLGAGRTMPKDLKILSANYDAGFVTWGEFAYEAFKNYISSAELAISPENVNTGTPGAFEKTIVGLLNSFINYMSGALGLWSLDELIFNDGIRGGNTYVGGVFPSSWESVIWTLFYVIEIIGIAFLLYSIIHNIFKRSMATVNPFVRASMMDATKNLLISIFVLILIPIVFRLMFSMSASLTKVFSSALGTITATERFKSLSVDSGSLGGCIMQLFYIGAMLYFNFFYMLRSVTIALLIVLSPIFIVMYSAGGNWQQLTSVWAKELLANVLIQPLHAFALTLILLLPSTSRAFENIVLIYMLIPFTSMSRSLFFGTSGGLLHNISQQGQRSGENGIKFAGKAAGGAALGAIGVAAATAKGAGKGGSREVAGESGFGRDTTEKNIPEEIKSKAPPTKTSGTTNTVGEKTVDNSSDKDSFTAKEPSVSATKAASVDNSDSKATFTAKEPSMSAAKAATVGGVIGEKLSHTGVGRAVTTIKESPLGQTANAVMHSKPVVAAGKAASATIDVAGGMALGTLGGGIGAVGNRNLGMHMTQMGNDWALKGGAGLAAAGAVLMAGKAAKKGTEPPTEFQPSHTLDQNSRGFSTADGGMTYEIPQDSVKDHGFDSVSENRNGGMDFVTSDTGFRGIDDKGAAQWESVPNPTIDQGDANGYAAMANTFARGNDAEKTVLRQNGFEHVAAETLNGAPTGRFAVSTNRNLPEGVGYQATVDKSGGVVVHQTPASAGTPAYRTPQKSLTNPNNYQRTVDGKQGYTSAGLTLTTQSAEPAAVISNGAPAPIVPSAGVTNVVESGKNVEVTYDTGIIGKDDGGSVVYTENSPMASADRENLVQASEMWNNGTESDRSFMQQIGYQEVRNNPNGSITAVYNENASRLMGGVIHEDKEAPTITGPGEVKTSINLNSREVRDQMKESKVRVHIPKVNRGKPIEQ